MYQNIHINRSSGTVYLWDDKQGLATFPYQRYCYKKSSGGKYRSIYGDELSRVTDYHDSEPDLFESDLFH